MKRRISAYVFAFLVGLALACLSPIIGQLATLKAGSILEAAGIEPETQYWGKPCKPYHDTALITGALVGFAVFFGGVGLAGLTVAGIQGECTTGSKRRA